LVKTGLHAVQTVVRARFLLPLARDESQSAVDVLDLSGFD
jgi:hypothetical protein